MDQTKITKNVAFPNIHLDKLEHDFLYHLGLDTKNFNLLKMFGDVKFVVMGGSPKRMENFAYFIKNYLCIDIPVGCCLENISKDTDRYSLFKIGPILSVSHGIGSASLSILLHELIKLLKYAKCKDVTFLRIGTCGLIGFEKGTIAITTKTYNNCLKPHFERVFLGKKIKISTEFDDEIAQKIKKIGDNELNLKIVLGATMSTDDFYEEQGRTDGAFCRFSKKEKNEFLNKLFSKGIINIEMEANLFSAYCLEANLKFAIICVGLLNRLKEDQIDLIKEEYSHYINNLFNVVVKVIN